MNFGGAHMEGMEPDLKLVMIEAFRRHDQRGDGVISKEKLAKVLSQLGLGYLKEGDIDMVLNATAVDGQVSVDEIQYQDLVDWITSPSTRSPDALSRCSTSADSMEKPQARVALEAVCQTIRAQLRQTLSECCPMGHPTKKSTVSYAHVSCNGCRRQQAPGCTILSCRLCNFDLCDRCAELQQVADLTQCLDRVAVWLSEMRVTAGAEDIEARRRALEEYAECVFWAISRPLTVYFETNYLRGLDFDGARYRPIYDETVQLHVLEHGSTGIRIWAEALDFRKLEGESSEPTIILFMYTDAKGLTAIARESIDHDALLAANVAGGTTHFGAGIVGVSKEPHLFGSKEAILFNNHWPCGHELAQAALARPSLQLDRQLPAPPQFPNANSGIGGSGGGTYLAHHNSATTVAASSSSSSSGASSASSSSNLSSGGARSSGTTTQFTTVGTLPTAVTAATTVATMATTATNSSSAASSLGFSVELLEAGPQDPRNRSVCEWILTDESKRHLADYCIPLIVPERLVYNIWERSPPDLIGWSHGCNRWGEKQWAERDICMVQVSGESTSHVIRSNKAQLLRERLSLLREANGDRHPDTLAMAMDLAALLKSLGEYTEAESLYRQDLMISEEQLGPMHPDTLTSVDALASLLKAMGRFQEAEVLYRRALEGSESQLGPTHPDTLTSRNNLAGLLKAVGKYDEALAMYRKALKGSQETLGMQHPDTLTSMYNLAGLLQARGALTEAEHIFRTVLRGREEVLGAADPRTIRSAVSLASLLEQKSEEGAVQADSYLRGYHSLE